MTENSQMISTVYCAFTSDTIQKQRDKFKYKNLFYIYFYKGNCEYTYHVLKMCQSFDERPLAITIMGALNPSLLLIIDPSVLIISMQLQIA